MSDKYTIIEGIVNESVENGCADDFDICRSIITAIELKASSEKEAAEFLQVLFYNWEINEIKVANVGIEDVQNDSEGEKGKKNALAVVYPRTKIMLNELLAKNEEEVSFYKNIWRYLDGFSSEKNYEKEAALFTIWTDRRIPYFSIKKMHGMTNDEYKGRRRNNMDSIKRMRFLFWTPFYTQKTERTLAMVKLLESIEDEDDKSVCLAAILDEFIMLQKNK